jgi:serine/threonine protein kinase
MEFKILSETDFHKVIALSDTEVGKIVYSDAFTFINKATGEPAMQDVFKKNIDDEIERLKFANSINDLLVKFIRKESFEGQGMMVMERLYRLPYDHFTKKIRKEMVFEFLSKLKQLHSKRFFHGDIVCPLIPIEERYDNIVLTKTGLRLIDTGFSRIVKSQEDLPEFVHGYTSDLAEFEEFTDYLLGFKKQKV